MSLDRPPSGLPPRPAGPEGPEVAPDGRVVPPGANVPPPPPPRPLGPDGRPSPPVVAVPDGARPDGPRPAGMAPVPAPETRMLPPHQTKLDRVTGHLAALSVDLREWTELRVDLVKRQVEGIQAQIERFQHFADAAPLLVPAVVLALTALFFLLVTVALGIGALIGSYWAGFAITTLLLFVGALTLGVLGLRRVRAAQRLAEAAREKDRGDRERTVEEIRASQAQTVRQSAV